MKKFIKVFLCLCLVFSIIISSTANVYQASAELYNLQMSLMYRQTEARKMLDKVNEFRASDSAWYWSYDGQKVVCDDLKPIVFDYGLEKVAMQRCAELVIFNSQERPNTTDFEQVYYDMGVHQREYGENIFKYYGEDENADTAFADLIDDKYGHDDQGCRRNLLGKYEAIGIAHIEYDEVHYWVMEFLRDATGTPETEPVNGEKLVTVETVDTRFSDVVIEYVSGATRLGVGESMNAPVYNAKVSFTDRFPSDQPEVECCGLEFTSADGVYVSVNNGIVTGLSAGTGTISGTYLGKNFSCAITVVNEATGAKVQPEVNASSGDKNQPVDNGNSSSQNNTAEGGKNATGDNNTSKDNTQNIPKAQINKSLKKGDVITAEGARYTILSTEKKTVEYKNPTNKKASTYTIPDEISYEGTTYKVTKLAAKAFSKNKTVKSVVIGKNITSIGKNAFYKCSSLKKVTFNGSKLTKIGKNAFKGVAKNATASVPVSVKDKYSKLIKKTMTVKGRK